MIILLIALILFLLTASVFFHAASDAICAFVAGMIYQVNHIPSGSITVVIVLLIFFILAALAGITE